jgi:HSP20 family protein
MDQFFDDAFRPMANNWGVGSRLGGSNTPALNVKEHTDRFEISLTVPGVDYNKLRIELHEKVLTISYEEEQNNSEDNNNQVEQKADNGEMLRQEYSEYFSFSRSVALPKNVDEDSIEATYKKGILNITVKKLPESQPKQVQIKTEE